MGALALAVSALLLLQGSGYVPARVYDTGRRAFADFELMLADVATADVVFVGEQHDDPDTHRLEAAILEGLQRRGVRPTVSLEMFERDAQAGLDAYLAGRITEEEWLTDARPWPRYRTDYRPLVELARTQGWPVLATNVPRRLASAVARGGAPALATLPAAERAWAARDLECPEDASLDRFAKSMAEHPAGQQTEDERRASLERYYWSQCVKDETMAESIAAAIDGGTARPVVHFNGAFHSDYAAGTAERTRRRLPDRRIVVISMLPVADLDRIEPGPDDVTRGRYLVYTVSATAPASPR